MEVESLIAIYVMTIIKEKTDQIVEQKYDLSELKEISTLNFDAVQTNHQEFTSIID